MRPEEIRAHMRRKPFEPFRLVVKVGSGIAIWNVPCNDGAIVMTNKILVGKYKDVDEIPLRIIECDLRNVLRVEPIKSMKSVKRRKSEP